jgi:NAD dependent epimerase/dehydratase family enzyme
MESPDARGTFNLTAPGPVTNTELARTLGRVLHRPAALPVPAVALRLLFGEMSTVLLDGQRALPQRLTAHDFSFRFPELGSALRDVLG